MPGAGPVEAADADAEQGPSPFKEAWEQARALWPSLQVDESDFLVHLAECLPADAEPMAALAKLHLGDLLLARACLGGDPSAAAAFERQQRPVVAKYLARLNCAPDVVEEITQIVLTRALVHTIERPSSLAGYQGRSTLSHFIGITAQRLVLDDRRAVTNERKLIERLAREPSELMRGPEQSLLRNRYKEPLEEALRTALAGLAGRERVVMRLSLVGQLSTVRIAKMYGVNQATISRWLARARLTVWSEVKQRLGDQFGVPLSDLDELLVSVYSGVDIGLSAILSTRS